MQPLVSQPWCSTAEGADGTLKLVASGSAPPSRWQLVDHQPVVRRQFIEFCHLVLAFFAVRVADNELAAGPSNHRCRMHDRGVGGSIQPVIHYRSQWTSRLNATGAARRPVIHLEPVMIRFTIRQAQGAGLQL